MTGSVTNPKDKRVCLGKITSAHGVKGLVKLLPFGEDYSLLETISPLYTNESGDATISISIKSGSGKYLLATVKGCNDREGADKLRGTEIWVSRACLPELQNDNEFYIEDLTGLKIYTAENSYIGTVVSVQNYGSSDLLEVKPDIGETFYIPFLDEYISKLDIKSGKITVKNIEAIIFD